MADSAGNASVVGLSLLSVTVLASVMGIPWGSSGFGALLPVVLLASTGGDPVDRLRRTLDELLAEPDEAGSPVGLGERDEDLREAVEAVDSHLRDVEGSLERERQRRSAILQHAPDGIVRVDHDGTVLEVNDRFEAVVGSSATEVEGPLSLTPWTAGAWTRSSPE